ncbi:DNA cytosine methyltransferase [Dongia sp.]|uniref:DNA cytosine methyltransferase n=1 Tax=Dongia sp. TaxID=1977262 RepID=UPI0037524D25
MRSVELFSGCGGLALGMARAGFKHSLLVEWNIDAIDTLNLNKQNGVEHVKRWPIEKADVREIDWAERVGSVDVVAGGPPCQPFSIGGKHRGNADARDMWPEAVRAVRELSPDAFVFENVRGLARPAFSDYLNWICHSLQAPSVERKRGEAHLDHLDRIRRSRRTEYQVRVLKVNAADYGAAQKRNRVVIVGVRSDLDLDLGEFRPTHSRERLLWDQYVTGEYWKRHGLKARGREPSSADLNIVEALKHELVPPAGEAWRTVRDCLDGLGKPNGKANHVFQAGARSYVGHTGSPLDEPAKALKAGDHGVPGGENMMVQDDGSVRYFTVREAARLQGLPDDWAFASSWSESMRQLGNAVPVELSTALGGWVTRGLKNRKPSRRAA